MGKSKPRASSCPIADFEYHSGGWEHPATIADIGLCLLKCHFFLSVLGLRRGSGVRLVPLRSYVRELYLNGVISGFYKSLQIDISLREFDRSSHGSAEITQAFENN